MNDPTNGHPHPAENCPTITAMGSPKLPKLRHGVFSSAPTRAERTGHPLNGNDNRVTNGEGEGKPLLRVDCGFGDSAGADDCGSAPPLPVTPSPAGGGWKHGIKGGWRVPACHSKAGRSLGLEGKRIGFDGTLKTPSLHLLKPTASSLGHRVAKVAHSSALLQSSMYSSTGSTTSPRMGVMPPPSPKQQLQQHEWAAPFRRSQSTGCADNNAFHDDRRHKEITKRMAIDPPSRDKRAAPAHTPALDPFRNIQGRGIYGYDSCCPSMDDEEIMDHQRNNIIINNNSSEESNLHETSGVTTLSFLENSHEESTSQQQHQQQHNPSQSPIKLPNSSEASLLDQSPFPTPLPHQRRSTWSPMGSERQRHWSQFIESDGSNCPEILRSHLFDPVASQLLACQEERDLPFVSLSSMNDTILESDDDNTNCHEESLPCSLEQSSSQCTNSNNIAHSFRSMPNLSTLPDLTTTDDDHIQERAPSSPMPVFRKVSGSLHDVKTDEDMTLLARPIPRKWS